MSLCDIWADAGLRVGKLRDPRAFALMGSPLCMSHIGYPPWGELRGSHIPPVPPYHREVGSVLRGWLACLLAGGMACLEAGLQLPLLTSSESSPGCGSDPAQCDPHAFSCHLTPPQKLARQGFPLPLTDEETDVPRV